MSRDILHVLAGIGRGGIESWLMHVFRTSQTIRDRSALCLTLGPHGGKDTYEDEVRAMGIPRYEGHFSNWGLPFAIPLARLIRELRPRVVHAHMNYMSGWATATSRWMGVPKRIAHYHVTFPVEHNSQPRKTYIRALRGLENATATHVLGCSADAISTYFGPAWRKDPRRRVLPYGINLKPFAEPVDRRAIRDQWGIPPEAFVVGHVGRFDPQKNHEMILQIAAELASRHSAFRLMLVGDGRGRPQIEDKIKSLGIQDQVILTGVRDDVPSLMVGAMDVFLFPSHYEGFGIVAVEAQAAGLPCVMSDVVPDEATVIDEMVTKLPLSASPATWADAICSQRNCHAVMDQSRALELVRQSPFDIESAVEALEHVYDEEM